MGYVIVLLVVWLIIVMMFVWGIWCINTFRELLYSIKSRKFNN